MSGNVMSAPGAAAAGASWTDGLVRTPATCAGAAELTARIRRLDASAASATVVGYGNMGRKFVAALRALGVPRIRVCSRSVQPLEELRGVAGVETLAGGLASGDWTASPEELAIVATPTDTLVEVSRELLRRGFRRLLIEKPVSLWSSRIAQLAAEAEAVGATAACAYNRAAYPSTLELSARAAAEGGITSCAYTFTEMIKADWTTRFPAEELARWGIANSLHVLTQAHALIGAPAEWTGHRAGGLDWHPSGSVFVGTGVSTAGVPFTWHADWTSKGRWSVEAYTRAASYRLCPLEQLSRKSSALGDWEPVPSPAFAADIKAGIVEEVAAMLSPEIRQMVALPSLAEAAALTRFAEQILGYPQ
jgi:predicted dehydrogenase